MKKSSGMYVIVLNTLVLLVVEVYAHHKSNAMSILGEAFHMLSDILSVCISFMSAIAIKKCKTSSQYTFGLERLEVLSSCVCVMLLWVPSVYLMCTSVKRLYKPEEIDRKVLLITSGISIFVNVANVAISVNIDKNKNDMNVSSMHIHAVTDLMQSLGMCVSAISLYISPDYVVIDLVCTMFACAVCLLSSIKMVKEVAANMLDISPVNVEAVKDALMELPQIEGVDDIRIWSINRRNRMAMVKLSIFRGESPEDTLNSCKDVLKKRYSMTYTNIEIKSY